ncbi:MAG: peptide-methionine (S)-S-oxide reductase MsrA [Saprospiraceae bacterium]
MKALFLLAAFITLTAAQCPNEPTTSNQKEANMTNAAIQNDSVPQAQTTGNQEVATLGGGCFWCVEAIYQDLKGVSKVESGYAGGSGANPTYREVCTGLTGHAEVVQVTFDPAVISFRDICDIFFTTHDPTTLNRQGADVGTQYRSVIFYHSPEQKAAAEAAKTAAAEIWDDPIVTEISPAAPFYKAENYHQNYFKDNTYQPYCQAIIAPKVKKFRQKYAEKLKQ